MTERLYLKDPYLTRFRARVVAVRELGGRPAVVLDRSAFYPEGGGQPADRGSLGGVAVVDVQEQGGEVLHAVERALPEGELDAEVDWARRLDHMQQHHGQHLLSAAFDRLLGAPTTSFHLGDKSCTIDLGCSVSKLDTASLRAVEAEANRTVWGNFGVVSRDFSGEERARLPLRKEAVKGDRVVVVESVDASPCGGTHPRSTGEVGAISVLRAQKWGSGAARVEFVCGGRVVKLLAELHGQIASASEALKCAPAELAEAVKRAAAESHARRKAAEALEAELAGHLAAGLAAAAPGVVVMKLSRSPALVRAVAQALVVLGRTALLAAVDEGRAHLCFARPKAAGGPAMGELVKQALAVLGGKGGGSAEFATGSGDPAKLDEALQLARASLGGP